MDVKNLANTGDKLTSQLRDAARTLGAMVAVVWLLAGIGYAVIDPWTLTSELVIVFLFFLALGVGIAWWKEGAGGIMLVVLSLAFSIFACIEANHNRVLAALLSGVPFLVVGILFVVTWQRAKKTPLPDSPPNTTSTGIDVQGSV
jgi:hypothetical protein